MNDFDYQAPASVAEAVELLAKANGSAKVLAGGTDLIVQLREGLRRADLVVDVKRIPELVEARLSDAGASIGAATPCYKLYDDPEFVKDYAGVADAARIIGSWQIQSRASLGGNICNASPAADTIPILIAYEAVLKIQGPSGSRELPIEQFFKGPGQNALEPGEMLVSIELPKQSAKSGGHYQRFIPRNEMDIAVVGVGSWVQLNDAGDAIEKARIGLGAVAPTPLFAQEASDWLAGKPANDETFAQAGELARKIASPISDMRGPAEYRVHLVGVLVQRTLAGAAARARGLQLGNGKKV